VCFPTGQRHSSLKSVAVGAARRLFGRDEPKPPREDIWVLRDVEIRLRSGDRLGVVGRNGAGKTTLMRVMAGIYPPSVGSVHRKGRIAPILQLGLGFNPEMTGVENVYLAAAIAGIPRRSMTAKLPSIFRFAELEDWADRPVKYYSTGMHARLAFSVATELETEILLLDEVFAVGDLHWVQRALARVRDLISRSQILVLVSHNLPLVEDLCNRAILLEAGRVQLDAGVAEVLAEYRSRS